MISRRMVFRIVIITVFLMALAVAPATAARTITENGTNVFVGEENLVFDGDFAGTSQLVHYTGEVAGSPIDKSIAVPAGMVSSLNGGIPTGCYYAIGSAYPDLTYVNIQNPEVMLDAVLDNSRKDSVDGKSVTRNTELAFKIGSNVDTGDVSDMITIEVTLPGGGIVTNFGGQNLRYQADGSTRFIGPISLNKAAAGTYTAVAKWVSTSDFFGKGYDSNPVFFEVTSRALAITSNRDTVIRGNSFTVTITGESNGVYYLYVKDAGDLGDWTYPWMTTQNGVNFTTNVFPRPAYYPASAMANVTTTAAGTRTVQFDTNRNVKDQSFTICVRDPEDGSRYDKVKVRVEAGTDTVTITTSGIGTYYIGKEITLSGTCTYGDKVYLFMTGPNLDANGVNLNNLEPVRTGGDETFTRVDVEVNDTWSYKWNTADLIKNGRPIDAGGYTIYVVMSPVEKARLSEARYATASINLRTGFLRVDPISDVVAKGDDLKIAGIAEGKPSNVYIWIFGKNYYGGDSGTLGVAEANVGPDSSFEKKIETKDLATGQYFVVIQHPMVASAVPTPGFNAAGSILWDSSGIRGTGISPVTLTNLSASAATSALISALASPNIPDTYVQLMFFVDDSGIRVDMIADQIYGETFTVTGTSDYPAGTAIPYQIIRGKNMRAALSGEVIVGNNGDWSFEVDSTMIGPGAYTLLLRSSGDLDPISVPVATVSFDIYDSIIHPAPPEVANYQIERISITPSLDNLSSGDRVTLNGTISLHGPMPERYRCLEFATELQNPAWSHAIEVGHEVVCSRYQNTNSFTISWFELEYGNRDVHVPFYLSGKIPEGKADNLVLLRILQRDFRGEVIPDSEYRLSFTPVGSSQSPISGNALTLHPGWNFISIPRHLETGNDTASIFTPIDTAGHSALRYDTAGRTWIPLTPTDRLAPLEGIWIYSSDLVIIPLTFSTDLPLPPPERSLAQGWNAVGVTGTSSASARDTLLSVKRGWTTLIGFDAEEQDFEMAIVNGGSGANTDTRPIHPGRGYWLYMTEPGNLCAIGV